MRHYLYRHLLDGRVFYIGVGTKPASYNTPRVEYNRAYQFSNRNRYWNNLVKDRRSDVVVEIMRESDDRQEILDAEIFFINLYPDLTNLTDGGDSGFTQSKEILAKKAYNQSKEIHQYSLEGDYICSYKGYLEPSLKYRVSRSSIGNALTLKRPTCAGFQWRFYKKDKIENVSLTNCEVGKANKVILDLHTGIYYDTYVEISKVFGWNVNTTPSIIKNNNRFYRA